MVLTLLVGLALSGCGSDESDGEVRTGEITDGQVASPEERLTMAREALEAGDRRSFQKALRTLSDERWISGKAGTGLLMEAVQAGRAPMVSDLLEAGVDPLAISEEGFLPLQEAIARRRFDCADVLMDVIPDFGVADAFGQTPLTVAVQMEWEVGIAQLLQAESPLREEQPRGLRQSALTWAIARRDAPLAGKLMRAGADANLMVNTPAAAEFIGVIAVPTFEYYLKRESGVTPLMLAAVTGQADVVRALLDAGADKFAKTGRHRTTAIWLAAREEHISTVQALLGKPSDWEGNRFQVEVSLGEQMATLLEEGKPVWSTPISTGAEGYETPAGQFVVTNKHKDWTSSLYDDAPMPFFLRLNCSAIGLHAGELPGYPASHGCIRLPYENAKELFGRIPVGTRVTIVE